MISKKSADEAKKVLAGYQAQLKTKDEAVIAEIKEKLKKVNTRADFHFKRFGAVTDSYIEVQFFGHYVGGSYVHGHEVAPGYVSDIEYTTNRKCKWINYESCDVLLPWPSHDQYNFKVYYKQKIHDKPYKPKGEMLRIQHGYAFLSDCGLEWACLFLITKDLLKKDSRLKGYGFSYKNNIISIDGEKIACVVRYNDEEHYESFYGNRNCVAHRTSYDCIFDLFLDKKKFIDLFQKKHEQIIRDIFQNLNIPYTCSNQWPFRLSYPNGYYYVLDHDYHLFTKDDVLAATKRNNEYETGRRFVTTPSGQKVELKNRFEVDRDMYNSVQFQNYSPFNHSPEENNFMIARIICKTPIQFDAKSDIHKDYEFISNYCKDYPSITHFKQ